ncbi:cell envelope integrity protein TolA [Microbulbifer yueqingensis]|uniref:Cell division and transport-associated protein TolA n=1 Tax=Microbulbifer yueqingensis TaxID=658219 RepID=A0A1G8VTF2_9GAMM|nr:cell envelope integrity protein TolA [Microbulbifer yueqingensis]SDJ69279.1 Cell division and transport-associated protein TolA [Microbulbifer yueqingensis]
MNNASSYILPVVASLAFHGLLIAVLTLGWEASNEPQKRQMPKFVQAKLVTVDATVKKRSAPPKVDMREKRRQQELQRQREAKAERERRAALERKKKQEAEKKRKAEAERKRKAAEEKARKEKERKERERKEQLEQERQSAFEEALEEEEELLDAREDAQAVMSVAQAIQQRIESVWSRPPSARNGMLTVVKINFVPTGRVVAANIVEGSGNAALDRSVLTAIRRVETFPEVAELAREEPAVFEREVRTTLLNFRVEDLRQ